MEAEADKYICPVIKYFEFVNEFTVHLDSVICQYTRTFVK